MQDNLIGRTIDQYEIVDYIARGGMATVYKARQSTIGRTVAIKVIDPEYARDPTLMQRFRREVELIAQLQHPHILPVYDYGQIDGRPYIVMAYMPGGSVHDLIHAPDYIPLPQIARLLDQTADALDHAHREGVIHRDLKPSNILLDKSGNAHLADFGIAKVLGQDTQGLTGDRIVGTLSYMAPEMFRRGELGPGVDVYALGVTLYQMLAEEVPFSGDTSQVIGAHLHEPVPDIRGLRPDVPEEVDDVIRKAMAKYPDERYKTVREMSAAFHRAIEGREISDSLKATQKNPKAEPPPGRLPDAPRPEPLVPVPVGPESSWYDAPPEPAPPAPAPYDPYAQPAQPQYPAPPYPEPSRSGRRRGGGIPITLLIGILAGLLALLLLCGLGVYLYFGGPTPAEFDSPQGDVAEEPVVLPTTLPTGLPATEEPEGPGEPAQTDEPAPGPTPAVEDAVAIQQTVIAFDEAMRHALQTGDTSTLGSVARGKAFDDRVRALEILRQAGDCLWVYDHRSMDVFEIEPMDDTHAKVMANIDRGGEVVCAQPGKEYPEYAFSYVYTAVYVTEYIDGQWYVTEYCPYNNCPDYLKD